MFLLVFPSAGILPATEPLPRTPLPATESRLSLCCLSDRHPRLSLSPRLPPFLFWSSFSPILGPSLSLSRPVPARRPGFVSLPSRCARLLSLRVCLAFGGSLALRRRCRSINLRRLPPLSQGGSGDVGRAASPLPDAGRRNPGCGPGDGETPRGGAQGAPGGVRGYDRARATPRTFPPPTQPKPGARTPRRAHVVQPRLLERAARRLGAAR